jgi:NAD(P)-dependent dehydrogenase (short-subunit alcohol dehydrogenase family)
MKILITGSSRGIGEYLSKEFVKAGHVVYGTYNNTSPHVYENYHISKVNISEETEVVEWIKSIKISKDEKLVLINCAGINYNSFAHKADTKKWEKVISVNLFGSFYCIKNILPFMRDSGFGRIINFSSIVPQIGVPGTSAYSASKSALWGLTKSVSVENIKKGITCNVINPGYFNVGMIKDVPNEILDNIVAKIPSNKLGDPVDIFKTIQYLIETSYISGTSIDINGGLY